MHNVLTRLKNFPSNNSISNATAYATKHATVTNNYKDLSVPRPTETCIIVATSCKTQNDLIAASWVELNWGVIFYQATNAGCILLVVLVACVLGRSREYGTEIAASRLVKSGSWVKLNSTGSDRVVLGLRPAATLMQVSVGRGTLKWVRLRGKRHKNDINERPEMRPLVWNGHYSDFCFILPVSNLNASDQTTKSMQRARQLPLCLSTMGHFWDKLTFLSRNHCEK